MKTITKAFLLLLLTWAPSAFALTLQEAVNARYLSVSGRASSSYLEATLTVTNLTSATIEVDFSTSFFVQNNTSQRIGLTHELTTGAYSLRFPARWTGSLRFSSRCLDQNRPTPTTGVAFSSYGTISSQFAAIINALRIKASQSSVWAITDSGSLASAWKAADSRAPIGGGGGGGGGTSPLVDLSGGSSWNTSGSSINIVAGRIDNYSRTATTGTLRLRVVATTSRYSGGTLSGYTLGIRTLGQLRPGSFYSGVSGFVSYTRPPSGWFYTTISVEEYTASGWVIRDYDNMSSLVRF